MKSSRVAICLGALYSVGCGGTVDNQVRDSGREVGVSDLGVVDTGVIAVDAGPADTGVIPTDLGVADSGAVDVGTDTGTVVVDSGPMDAGVVPMDTGPTDTGPADTGPLDAGPTDIGPEPVDAGLPDAGPPDSGPPDTGPSCAAPQALCAGQCVNPQTNPAHCGTCGNACTAPTNGTPTCTAGACGIACNTGFNLLGATCAPCGAVGQPACSTGTACAAGLTACAGACRAAQTDPAHCGTCGNACTAPANGTAGCVAGQCQPTCNTGFTLVSAACVPCGAVGQPACATGTACTAGLSACSGTCRATQTDLTHCGTCGTACMGSGQPFTRAACVAGACVVECTTGYIGQPGSCVPLPPPRPVAPLSSVWISSRRPTFRWENPGSNDGAAIDFCSDRACATLLATEVFTGESGTPSMDLPANRTVYWRLRGRRGGRVGIAAHTSPVWQLHTPVRTTTGAVTTCGFQSRDINGDGYADLAMADSSIPGAVIEYGGTGALGTNAPTTTLTSLIPGLGGYPARGDFNGDGFGDVAIGASAANNHQGQVMVYLGRTSGLSTTAQRSLLDPSPIAGGNFGTNMESCDVNGDGFDDLIVCRPAHSNPTGRPVGFYVFHGNAEGIPATHATSHFLPATSFGNNVRCVGDVNGDGFNDVAANDSGGTVLAVYHGSESGLPSSPSRSHSPPSGFGFNYLSAARLGDVNQDGYADFAAGQWTSGAGSFGFDVYLGSSSGPAPSAPLRTTRGGDGVLSGAYVTSGGTFDGGRTFSVLIPQFRVGTGSLLEYQMRFAPSIERQTITRGAPSGSRGFGYAYDVGDLNGDGYCDLGVVSEGSHWVHLYYGSATGASVTPTQSLTNRGNFPNM